MTEAQFKRKKLSKIMSFAAYNRANTWYRNRYEIPERAKLNVDGVYKNSTHRQYLSKWLEAFIIKWVKEHKPEWQIHKVDNSGKRVLNRIIGGARNGEVIGTMAYAKNPNQILGEPDIRALRPGRMPLYFEVKIGNDRLSEEQKQFIDAGFGEVYVVKTLDGFFEVWDKIVS